MPTEDESPLNDIIADFIRVIFGFWKQHAIDFGYEPGELLTIDGNFVKIHIPLPVITGEGYFPVKEIAFTYEKNLWPYKRKLILRGLKKLKPQIPGHLIDSTTTIILASTIHGRHPPVKGFFNRRFSYKLREDTYSRILDALSNTMEKHVTALENGFNKELEKSDGAQDGIPVDIKKLMDLHHEFSKRLQDIADQNRPVPGTIVEVAKKPRPLNADEVAAFNQLLKVRWQPYQEKIMAIPEEEREDRRLDFRKLRKRIEKEVCAEVMTARQEENHNRIEDDLAVFNNLVSGGLI